MPEAETTVAVQAEMTPSCSRAAFLQPPDWRYSAAIEFIDEEAAGGSPAVPADIHLQYLIRGLKTMRSRAGRKYAELLWPAFCAAVTLGTTKRDSSVTAAFETCIITGSRIDGTLCSDLTGNLDVIRELYGKFFFDLSGITAIGPWMDDYLFSTEMHRPNSPVLRARLLAYYSGAEGGISAASTGPLSKSASALLKSIGENSRQRKVFDYLMKVTKLDACTYATLMEAAVKASNDRDFQEHMKDREDAGSGTLEELAAHIEEGIRAYSQHELESQHAFGADASNMLIPVARERD